MIRNHLQKITLAKRWPALTGLLLSMVISQSAMAAGIVASGGKIVLPRDDSIMMSGYVTLENTTDKEIILIKARSNAFKLSTINQSIKDSEGVREMLKSDLIIKPNSKIVMKKDGVHFVFSGPKSKLKAGKTVSANLYLSNSEKIPVEFKLVK